MMGFHSKEEEDVDEETAGRGCPPLSPSSSACSAGLLPDAAGCSSSPEEQQQQQQQRQLLRLLSAKEGQLARLRSRQKPQQPSLLLQSSRAAANLVLLENVLRAWRTLCQQKHRREQLRDLERRRVAASVFGSCTKLVRTLLHISRMQEGAAFTEWQHYNSLMKERDIRVRAQRKTWAAGTGTTTGKSCSSQPLPLHLHLRDRLFGDSSHAENSEEEVREEVREEGEEEAEEELESGPLLASPEATPDSSSLTLVEESFHKNDQDNGGQASVDLRRQWEGAVQLKTMFERFTFASLNRSYSHWRAFTAEARRKDALRQRKKAEEEARYMAERSEVRSQLEALRAWDQEASQRVRAMGTRGLYLEARREELLGRLQNIKTSQESLESEKQAVTRRLQEERASSAALRKKVEDEEEANAALRASLTTKRRLQELERERHQKEVQDGNAKLEHLEELIEDLKAKTRSGVRTSPVQEAIEVERPQWLATKSELEAQCRTMEEEMEAMNAAAALRRQQEAAEQEVCEHLRAELEAVSQRHKEEIARQAEMELEACEASQLAELDHYAELVAKLRRELKWLREEKSTMAGDLKSLQSTYRLLLKRCDPS